MICPKCDRPIRSLSQWHFCERVSVDSLFEGKSPELSLTFDRILLAVIDWPGVSASATKNCIVFTAPRRTFLVIRPLRAELEVRFYSDRSLGDAVRKSTAASSGRFENEVRITFEHEADESLLQLIRSSFELFC